MSDKEDKKTERKEKAKAFWQEYRQAVSDAKKEQDKLYEKDRIKSTDERAAEARTKE